MPACPATLTPPGSAAEAMAPLVSLTGGLPAGGVGAVAHQGSRRARGLGDEPVRWTTSMRQSGLQLSVSILNHMEQCFATTVIDVLLRNAVEGLLNVLIH